MKNKIKEFAKKLNIEFTGIAPITRYTDLEKTILERKQKYGLSQFEEEDIEKIEEAARYASELHEGQFRVSGEPYISHPIAVAEIVASLGLDSDSLCAALLHALIPRIIPITTRSASRMPSGWTITQPL